MALSFIYCYDAYCGWCYGFSPVIKQLSYAYQPQIHTEVLSGGMLAGAGVATGLVNLGRIRSKADARLTKFARERVIELLLHGTPENPAVLERMTSEFAQIASNARSLRAGHPWVFASDIDRAERGVQDGDVVSVVAARGRPKLPASWGYFRSPG